MVTDSVPVVRLAADPADTVPPVIVKTLSVTVNVGNVTAVGVPPSNVLTVEMFVLVAV